MVAVKEREKEREIEPKMQAEAGEVREQRGRRV